MNVVNTMVGLLMKDVEVDQGIQVFRLKRNEVKMTGIMTSSAVTSIIPQDNGLEIHTLNSIYDLEWLAG